MNMRKTASCTVIGLLALLSVGLGSIASADVVYSEVYTSAYTYDASTAATNIPESFDIGPVSLDAPLPGFTNTIDKLSTPTLLSASVAQSREGGMNDYILDRVTSRFTVSTWTEYTVAGTYTAALGYQVLVGSLYDVSAGKLRFYSQQASNTVGSLTLGGLDGDVSLSNILIGSPTGLLNPTHIYEAEFYFGTGAQHAPDAGGAAAGSASISFAEITIPEPASAILVGMFGLAGGFLRRTRRAPASSGDIADE